MAEAQQLVTDQNGFITEGRFAGMHISQLAEYASSLEQHAQSAPGEQPPPQTPQQRLAAAGGGRVDNATLLTWQRLEQDDETAFAAQVGDYEEYRKDIEEIKRRMPPEQRVQRGFHEMLYTNVKLQKKPELRKSLYGQAAPAVVEETEEGEEQQAETEPVAPQVPAGRPTSPAPVKPKAAPPAAPALKSTPARTTSAPANRGTKLVATDKVRAFCIRTGMEVDAYLKDMASRGMTQDDLDRISAPRSAAAQNRPRSIYDER
jgi:hypothetical protein